ncbi:MAG: hypothetical protein HY824_17420 [Acidobacteria bacterium]|nr:hypothetical protein [Acidobacteriota bacterium]
MLWIGAVTPPAVASAQSAELVGSRALGMGGAFVAVASDSSATWWNPAGIAAGPFLDVAMAQSRVEVAERLPAWRQKVSWFALATPPIGLSYYRFRITDIQPFDPTGQGGADREERRAGVPVRSLSASQLGVTLVHTLLSGVHAGATLKYVRGTVQAGRDDGRAAPGVLLDRGDAFDEGDGEGRFDMDVGVLAVAGAVRVGARMRNVLKPRFGPVRLPRQTRVGVAIDAVALARTPLTLSVDADVERYATAWGRRRVVALGGEQWLRDGRLAVRAGGRVNTTGGGERAATAGASVAVRAGVYLDGHVVRGGTADERGWGLAARVSY